MSNTIKELLGIDFDDMGLAETIDSVTEDLAEMRFIHELIGRAIFKDGGLLEDESVNPRKEINNIAFDDKDVMDWLEHYAARCESFMERL